MAKVLISSSNLSDNEDIDFSEDDVTSSSEEEEGDVLDVLDDDESGAIESESEKSDDEDENAENAGNKGLAAVMAKILNKSVPSHKPPIMAKALTEKQLEARKRTHEESKEKGNIVIIGETGEAKVKDELTTLDTKKVKKPSTMEEKMRKDSLGHLKPSLLDMNKEKELKKIATRGVVQLFNAVKQQQNQIKERIAEAGSSARRIEKAEKSVKSSDFLDKLKTSNIAESTTTQKNKTIKIRKSVDTEVKDEVKDELKWDVLRDDFMMTSQSMKDWDKPSGNDEEDNDSVNSGADLSSDDE